MRGLVTARPIFWTRGRQKTFGGLKGPTPDFFGKGAGADAEIMRRVERRRFQEAWLRRGGFFQAVENRKAYFSGGKRWTSFARKERSSAEMGATEEKKKRHCGQVDREGSVAFSTRPLEIIPARVLSRRRPGSKKSREMGPDDRVGRNVTHQDKALRVKWSGK